MSFPFNIGQPYVCGAGTVICTEWERNFERHGEVSQTFTIKAYGDIFHDLSTPPTTGTAAPPERQRMERRSIRDETGRVITEQAIPFSDTMLARVFSETAIRPATHTYADGQFTPIAPPAARTPACLVDALCRRGRFLTLPAPPPGETGA